MMLRSSSLASLLLILGVLLLRFPVSAQAEAPPLFCPLTGHWYQPIAAEGVAWEEARTQAAARTYQGQKGYLATMTSAEENNWVRTYLPQAVDGQYYLGGYQPPGSPEPGGNWRWVTGEPWRYTNWDAPEPNDGLGTPEAYVAFITEGRWMDYRDPGHGYVIEYGAAPPPIRQIAFSQPVSYEIHAPGKVDAVDFDGDHHIDLAVSSTDDLAIMYGLGDGTFGPPTFLGMGAGAGETLAPDVDQDGKADLVAVGGDSVYVYRSTGGRTYGRPQRYVLGSGMWGIHSADWNDDGYPDLATAVSGDHRLSLFLNKGDGTFQPPVHYGTGSFPGFITSGDWNRDGKTDLAVSNVTDGTISVFLGDGTGKLTGNGGVNTQGEYPIKIVTDDFDGDGLADLISGNYFGHRVGIMFGNGDGTFQTALTYSAPPYPLTLVTVDLDGDGDPDIATPNAGARYFTVLRNTDGIPGLAFPIGSAGDNTRNLSSGDFNEDGRPDIVVSCESSDNITVHLNETAIAGPARPTNLLAVADSSTAIQLSWRDASTNELGFRVDRKTDSTAFALLASVGPNVHSFRNSGLAPNTRYYYQVRAYNSVGNSDYSNVASAITPLDVPTPPTGLRATTLTPRSIRLDWTDTSNNETGFGVERRETGAQFTPLVNLPAGTVTFTNTVLPDKVYFYRLRALGRGGHSAYTREVRGETPPEPPRAPTSLTATVVGAEVRLAWQDNSTNESGFQLERRQRTGAYTRIASPTANAVTAVDGNVSYSVPYTYRLRAINRGGESAYSNEVTATRLPGLTTLTTLPASVKGGKAVNGRVTLAGPAPDGGAVVKLTSANKLVRLPATVTVVAGASSMTFRASTKRTGKTKNVRLTATYNATTAATMLKVKK